jgi:hypothetical protein
MAMAAIEGTTYLSRRPSDNGISELHPAARTVRLFISSRDCRNPLQPFHLEGMMCGVVNCGIPVTRNEENSVVFVVLIRLNRAAERFHSYVVDQGGFYISVALGGLGSRAVWGVSTMGNLETGGSAVGNATSSPFIPRLPRARLPGTRVVLGQRGVLETEIYPPEFAPRP